MTYAEQVAALGPELASVVAGLRNTEWILNWARDAGIPFHTIDLLQQDEYSYDLFLQLPDSRWLVFGIT